LTRRRHAVELKPHQRSIGASEDRPVLEAALAAGLNIPHSCKSGHCGSCRARLIRGRIEYPNGRPLGLTEGEAADGFVLLCQARALSDLTVEVRQVASAAEAEIKTLPARIASLRKLAPDVMQVLLRLPAVERLEFAAGQYLDVLIEGGRRRSFSIASPPHDSDLIELHARHVTGGSFTHRLFGALAEGALLKIEGPLGQFVYREEARPALLVAGGTGFAPLKSMLRHALERGSQRRFVLYWGARTAVDLYEESLVLDWTRRHPQLTFVPVLSEATAASAGVRRSGWVHEAVLADHPSLAPYEVYAAGPPAMIEAIRSTFPPRGLPAGQLHFDSFDYAP
jgi:CDP-4-dehydro-6-deoxyglucose reductase, E3